MAAVTGRCYRLRARWKAAPRCPSAPQWRHPSSTTCSQRQPCTIPPLLVNALHSEPDLSCSVAPGQDPAILSVPRTQGTVPVLTDPHSWGWSSVGLGCLSPRLSKPLALGAGGCWTRVLCRKGQRHRAPLHGDKAPHPASIAPHTTPSLQPDGPSDPAATQMTPSFSFFYQELRESTLGPCDSPSFKPRPLNPTSSAVSQTPKLACAPASCVPARGARPARTLTLHVGLRHLGLLASVSTGGSLSNLEQPKPHLNHKPPWFTGCHHVLYKT